jgi:hypothetical protein
LVANTACASVFRAAADWWLPGRDNVRIRRVAGWGLMAGVFASWVAACSSSTRDFNSGPAGAGDSGTGGTAGTVAGAENHAGSAGALPMGGTSGHSGGSGSGASAGDSTIAGAPAEAGAPGEAATAGTGAGGSAGATGGSAGAGGIGGSAAGSAGQGGSAGAGGTGGSAAGSGGHGGSAGAGGAPIGTICSKAADCALGFCVDGVCCENACTGNCKQCSAQGKCVIPPNNDDPGCPGITCLPSTTCRTYPAPPTNNRCASFGVCKTSANYCTFTSAPARTSCSASGPNLCDGAGNCVVPTVLCPTACAVDANVCCGGQNDASSVFQCTPNGTACPNGLGSITCDADADCALGKRCCLSDTPGGDSFSCVDAADCPPNPESMFVVVAPICQSTAIASPLSCPVGETCSHVGSIEVPPNWNVCH